MKRIITCVFAMGCLASHAQNYFTVNLNARTTNYWLAAIGNGLFKPFTYYEEDENVAFNPSCDFVFPVSIANNAPSSFGTMKGGYARAFSTPWKRVGDCKLGVGGSWASTKVPFGVYANINYKTNEVVFKEDTRTDRTHYFSPELGLIMQSGVRGGLVVEAGASYDMAFAYKGKMHDYGKEAVNSGFCINGGIGFGAEGIVALVKYSHPTYNFYNKDFTADHGTTYPFKDVNRKLGYISLEIGIAL